MEPDREHQLVFLRWTLIASLAYMLLIRDDGSAPSTIELAYVGLLLASNLLIPRIPYRNPRAFGSAILGVDSVFVLLGLLLCSSASQDLLIGYFLCIIMAAFSDSERRIASAAILVTGVYAMWIFRNWGPATQTSMLIRLPFLFVTTVFYGYMMQRVRSEHSRRVRAEGQVRSLDCLLQITRSFSSSLVTQEILQRVAETMRETLGIDSCRIHMVSETSSTPAEPIAVEALERREPIAACEPAGDRDRCLLAMPILFDVELLGVMIVEAVRRDGAFRDEEIELCQVIANAAAPALKNSRQFERLADMERAKSDFLSNLSHELRTPLSAILGYAELANEAADGADPTVRDFVSNISRSAGEMTRHVEGLLHLSQVTLGREQPRVERVDMKTLLSHLLEGARRVSGRRDLDFGFDLDPGLSEVYADGGKIERIVQQMLLNSVKFTEKGSIRIAAALVDGARATALTRSPQPWERVLSVRVADTGIGIAAADLDRVFHDFRQGDGSMTRKYAGLGIGLTLCRRLAEVLGGTVRVESEPGTGSVFEVLVPVQVEAQKAGVAA